MDTVFVAPSTWDLALDASGNIAMATSDYAIAQDAASAVKLFLGELYYDTTKGVPYFAQVLGKGPPLSLVKSLIINAALTVPGVTAANVYITAFKGRTVTGQLHVTTTAGSVLPIGF